MFRQIITKNERGEFYMKTFFKILGYCFIAFVIWALIVLIWSTLFVKKTADVIVDSGKEIIDSIQETQKNSLELVGNVSMTSSGSFGYYTYNIEGILKNVSGKKLDYAQVSFVIYDMAGNNIGSAFDNINYIDANGTWKFKAIYFGQETNIKYSTEPEITTW